MQYCCLWTIYLCLLTPNCTRNHVVIYTKNIHEKFTRFWLAETERICHVTRVQSWIMNTKLQRARTLSKFRLPCLWEMPFSCILFLSNNMISRAGSLEKFSKTKTPKNFRVRSWVNGWRQSLKVPSMYHVLDCWCSSSCLSEANTRWRRPRIWNTQYDIRLLID